MVTSFNGEDWEKQLHMEKETSQNILTSARNHRSTIHVLFVIQRIHSVTNHFTSSIVIVLWIVIKVNESEEKYSFVKNIITKIVPHNYFNTKFLFAYFSYSITSFARLSKFVSTISIYIIPNLLNWHSI